MHVNNLVTFLSVKVNIMAFDITLYVWFSVNMNLCSFLSTAKDSIWSVDNCLKLDTDTVAHEWTKTRSFASSVAYLCVFIVIRDKVGINCLPFERHLHWFCLNRSSKHWCTNLALVCTEKYICVTVLSSSITLWFKVLVSHRVVM